MLGFSRSIVPQDLLGTSSSWRILRRYTKFSGTSERVALDLAHDALTSVAFTQDYIPTIFLKNPTRGSRRTQRRFEPLIS